jgi:hypothetical protein
LAEAIGPLRHRIMNSVLNQDPVKPPKCGGRSARAFLPGYYARGVVGAVRLAA